jgi:hypothetical protein
MVMRKFRHLRRSSAATVKPITPQPITAMDGRRISPQGGDVIGDDAGASEAERDPGAAVPVVVN